MHNFNNTQCHYITIERENVIIKIENDISLLIIFLGFRLFDRIKFLFIDLLLI